MRRARVSQDVVDVGKGFLKALSSGGSSRSSILTDATHYAEQSLRNAPFSHFDARQLALTAQTYGALSVRSGAFFDELSQAIESVSEDMKQPSFIAFALWGLAKAGANGVVFSHGRSAMTVLCGRLLDDNVVSAFRWQPIDMANIFWAIATARLAHAAVFAALSERCLKQDLANRFAKGMQSPANILWASATVRFQSPRFTDHMLRSVAARWASDKDQEPQAARHAVSALWSAGVLKHMTPATVEVVGVVRRLRLSDVVRVATVLSALAKLHHHAPMLDLTLKHAAEKNLQEGRGTDGRTLDMLLRACARTSDTTSGLYRALVQHLSLGSSSASASTSAVPASAGLAEQEIVSLLDALAAFPAGGGAAAAKPPPGKTPRQQQQQTQPQPRHQLVDLLAPQQPAVSGSAATSAALMQRLASGTGGRQHQRQKQQQQQGGSRPHPRPPPPHSRHRDAPAPAADAPGCVAEERLAVAAALFQRLPLHRLRPQQAAALLCSGSAMQFAPAALLGAASEALSTPGAVRELRPHEARGVLRSFVTLRLSDPRPIEALVASLPSSELPYAFWALAKLHANPAPAWLDEHLSRMQSGSPGLRSLNVVDTCNVAYFLGVSRVAPEGLLSLVQKKVAEKQFHQQLTPTGRRTLLAAASRLRCTFDLGV